MDLAVQKREVIGKNTKALLNQGYVPAELYGRGVSNLHLAVPAKDFVAVFKKLHGGFLNLLIDGEKRQALIKSVQRDPVSDAITHVDFYQIRLDESVRVKVPIVITGESPAVKEKAGFLVKAISEIEIEALPGNSPNSLEVDVSSMRDIGQSVRVGDMRVPQGVKFLVAGDTAIATVIQKMEEEAAVPTISVSEVKVETEEKKQERLAKKQEETAVSQ